MNQQAIEGLTHRLLNLPDRIMELAMGEIIYHLTIAQIRVLNSDGSHHSRRYVSNNEWEAWARTSDGNYLALHGVLMAVIAEWSNRHDGAVPKCADKARTLATPFDIPVGDMTMLPNAPLPFSESYDPHRGDQR